MLAFEPLRRAPAALLLREGWLHTEGDALSAAEASGKPGVREVGGNKPAAGAVDREEYALPCDAQDSVAEDGMSVGSLVEMPPCPSGTAEGSGGTSCASGVDKVAPPSLAQLSLEEAHKPGGGADRGPEAHTLAKGAPPFALPDSAGDLKAVVHATYLY